MATAPDLSPTMFTAQAELPRDDSLTAVVLAQLAMECVEVPYRGRTGPRQISLAVVGNSQDTFRAIIRHSDRSLSGPRDGHIGLVWLDGDTDQVGSLERPYLRLHTSERPRWRWPEWRGQGVEDTPEFARSSSGFNELWGYIIQGDAVSDGRQLSSREIDRVAWLLLRSRAYRGKEVKPSIEAFAKRYMDEESILSAAQFRRYDHSKRAHGALLVASLKLSAKLLLGKLM